MTTEDQTKATRSGNGGDVGSEAESETVPKAQGEVEVGTTPVEDGGPDTSHSSSTELSDLKDRHLRLAAEFENFRKRTARERTETWSRAQADVVGNILDALDDFGRVLETDPAAATAGDLLKGIELVERKLMRELVSAGLEKVGEAGEGFDPNLHEAIGSLPADSEAEDQTVGAVFQVGYRFGGTLLRPAKVQVRMWQDGGAQ